MQVGFGWETKKVSRSATLSSPIPFRILTTYIVPIKKTVFMYVGFVPCPRKGLGNYFLTN